ncbi:MAG TPA: 30S ribosomal protein S11 [Patescibacteria group bacterium]|nr:30S ribosomal protein S11 [Patescibacteria group bacterium]
MTDTEKQVAADAAMAAEPAEEKLSKPVKAKPKRGKKTKSAVPQGKAYVQSTYNNTIVSFTDPNGNVLGWSSAGVVGFKGPKKSTPYAASVVVKDAAEKVKDYGLKDVNVFISGVGQGREGALRAFQANGINVLSIKDITPVPHNGCRPSRPRRV